MTWRLASLLGRHGGDYFTKDIQLIHYVIWPWRRIFLNGACISISNLPGNIAWQTLKDDLRPEARGPLKSGVWGGRPTCHTQTTPLSIPSLTWGLGGGGWSAPCSGRFTHGKETRYPLKSRLGGPQDRCGKSRPQRDLIPGPSSL